jgi:hypothetical protein
MSAGGVDELVEALAADARPVRPLSPPLHRALKALGVIGLLGGLLIYFLSDLGGLFARYAGREGLMMIEMAAMLATGVLAVTGAFIVSVPGRSRRWLLAPLPTFVAWLLLSGIGCLGNLTRTEVSAGAIGHSADCLVFILLVSLVLGAPLVWRLSRARPIDPLPVALLGGLGTAALAAFLLQFFHAKAVTFIDLGVHVVAIALVVGATALLNRRALAPA